ncbi:MAG: hypothetical protein ACRCUM_00905 [Mycoplasmoidaceae bacterium]
MNKKIKLSLLGTLIAGSALAITLPMVSCSGSAEETVDVVLTVDAASKTATEAAITTNLKAAMEAATTREAKVELAATWKVDTELSKEQLKIITDAIKFTADGKDVLGADAIEKVIFATATEIPAEDDTEINGPTLKVHFKSGYKLDLTLDVGTLGKTPPAPTPEK